MVEVSQTGSESGGALELELNVGFDKVSFWANGQRRGEGRPDFTERTLAELREFRAFEKPKEYGEQLMRAAFPGEVLDAYRRAALAEPKRMVRLRLNVDADAPMLHGLWWESLYDVRSFQNLGASNVLALSRYLVPRAPLHLPATGEKLKLLAVIANPQDLGQAGGRWGGCPPLDEGQQCKWLEDAIRDAGLEDRIELHVHTGPAGYDTVRIRLEDEGFHILHLVGYGVFLEAAGTPRGHLLLEEDATRAAAPIDDEWMGCLVERAQDLQLVVLVTWGNDGRPPARTFTGFATQMVQRGVPAVIVTQSPVGMATARQFTSRFYGGLGWGPGVLDVAVNRARSMLVSPNLGGWDWVKPVLFMEGSGELLKSVSRAGAARPTQAASPIRVPVQSTSALGEAGVPPPGQIGLGDALSASKRPAPEAVAVLIADFECMGDVDRAQGNFYTFLLQSRLRARLAQEPGVQVMAPHVQQVDLVLSAEVRFFGESVAVKIYGIDSDGISRINVAESGHYPLERVDELAGICVKAISDQLLPDRFSSFDRQKFRDVRQYDMLAAYEQGISAMVERIGRDHPRWAEVEAQRARLLENISGSRQFGDTEQRKSERNEIIYQLTKLASDLLGISFLELCGLRPAWQQKSSDVYRARVSR